MAIQPHIASWMPASIILLLAAVDHYVSCREQVWEIRVTEIRNRSIKVLERFNQWRDRRDGDGDDAVAP